MTVKERTVMDTPSGEFRVGHVRPYAPCLSGTIGQRIFGSPFSLCNPHASFDGEGEGRVRSFSGDSGSSPISPALREAKSTFASGPVVSPYGDDYGYGGGGGGASAKNQNMRVSFFFLAIPIQSTDAFDVTSGNSEPWTEYWSTGLGGGLEFSYHMPPGEGDDLGSGVDILNMHCFPIRVGFALYFRSAAGGAHY
jgi:hypothetical protein